MPNDSVLEGLLLPETQVVRVVAPKKAGRIDLYVKKTSPMEVCPRCACQATAVYDRRWVTVRDAPLRTRYLYLHIQKRRFRCPQCHRPFTEPVAGIQKGSRSTERYRKQILWAAERFSDLSEVRRSYRCSAGFLYKTLYRELERRRRTRLYPFPKYVGLDEHFFGRDRRGHRQFVTVVTDLKNRRLLELVHGKSSHDLHHALQSIEGPEHVQAVVCDLADPYKQFAQRFFKNAALVADKFHVLRLLHPAISRHRIAITGDKRALPARRLLLKNNRHLDPFTRRALFRWLERHPALHALYTVQQALHRFYRIRGHQRAYRALIKLTDQMAHHRISELQTLRKTLLKWRHEICNYFRFRITNGPTEGFNNKAKLVKRRAYGYKSFHNYRLRLLNACA